MSTYIEPAGAHLLLHSDGVTQTCVATPAGYWICTKNTPPDPDPPTTGFAWPFPPNQITTEWEGYPGHKGVDWGFAGVGGMEVKAAQSGTVEKSGWYPVGAPDLMWNWGNMVEINHGAIGTNGETLRTVYAHMRDTPLVGVGATVTKGQTLGYVGTTGYSTGDHLHWETSVNGTWNQINPRTFMASYGE